MQILTPLQIARYVVGCLPFGPDSLLLTNCLAAQSGEPPIEELLKAKRPPGAAANDTAVMRDPLLPDCDWRQGLEQPLRVLHARPKKPKQEEAEESQAESVSTAAASPKESEQEGQPLGCLAEDAQAGRISAAAAWPKDQEQED